MSFDVHIGERDMNFTSNLGPFFRAHIAVGEKTGLPALEGLTGKQALSVLSDAFDSIDREYRSGFSIFNQVYTCHNRDRDLSAQYSPKNGWGSYTSALIFLMELVSACVEHARCRIHVSY